MTVNLAHYLILFSVKIEVAHSLTTETVLQCLCNIFCVYSHYVCLLAIDSNLYFGLTEFQVYISHLESGIVVNLIQEFG